MLLSKLMKAIDYTEIINRSGIDPDSIDIAKLSPDSRNVCADSIFVCISGSISDGHNFTESAYKNGCRIYVAERRPSELPDDVFIIITKNTRLALAQLSAAFFSYPADELTVIGITGTKGKTTTSLLIYNILLSGGIPVGYIGSNGITYDEHQIDTLNTTPESYELHETMRAMRNAGVKVVVMEVSSQALKLGRVHGIKFDIAVFTNLSPDHIGEFEHADFDEYKNCKRSLFTDYGAEFVVYNADDEYAAEIVGANRCPKASISGKGNTDADYYADEIAFYRAPGKISVNFTCNGRDSSFPVSLSFPGEFSVYNGLTAIAVCRRLGLESQEIVRAMKNVRIKGRFETYELPNGATAVIDYAHNGVSLKAALSALRNYEPNRLICLFGSVGGRTRMRRAELGLVASRDADFCIITSDNPDGESPWAIIGEIASYFTAGTAPYVAIPDRQKAIEYALQNSQPGDIILLAGKGHETYQLICGSRLYFSEADIIARFCSESK
jgi:UDP-N-acetylmuramoyl-L-alanyl-D-glutamate--2,6-diaminopimelate ligase